jgi:two-component system chemotaxis response regulator CheY
MHHDATPVSYSDTRPVLVVEDSADDFDTVIQAARLAKVPNRLSRAVDADVARSLLASTQARAFAFMLLDYDMPGVDGLALLDQVRRDFSLADLPVVVYTTSINPRDRNAFFAAGASAFHVKSVQHVDCLQTLAAIFAQWLNLPARPDNSAIAPGAGQPA